MKKADAQEGWSGTGRPRWASANRDRFDEIYLYVFVTESDHVYRCTVSAWLQGNESGLFPLDVSMSDFHALPSLTQPEAVTLLHLLLECAEHIPLDGEED